MTAQPTGLLLGTGNPGKLRDLQALFAPSELPLRTPQDLALDLQIEEVGQDYEANARLKASEYARAGGLWAVADDTGLEVAALDGAPGLYSARLAGPQGTDADRRRRLLELLAEEPRPWRARFVCTMVLASPTALLAMTRGVCPGEIVPEARGLGGFGYDSIFAVDGERQTMAELSNERKNKISHRARAAEAMLPLLERLVEEAQQEGLA